MLARLIIGAAAGALAACGPSNSPDPASSDSRIVRQSLYSQIVVETNGNVAEMQFQVGRRATRQTAVDLTDPLRLVIPYTRFMLVPAMVDAQPGQILLIGLGGGALNRFLRQAYPEATLTTVELDPAVRDAAVDHMGYSPDEKDRVVIEDGRAYLRKSPQKWNWILVDAYKGGMVPAHLKTREFYQLLKDHLEPGGAVALNLHAGNRLFSSDLATLLAVFADVWIFGVQGTGNVVALAFDRAAHDPADVEAETAAAPSAQAVLVTEHLRNALKALRPVKEGGSGQVLTDDFVPVEYLESLKP